MHNKAVGEPAQHWNTSGIADGMIGGVLPTAIYYIPIAADNVTDGTSRYWTYLNIPKPDSDECQGDSREPGVWIRYQQVSCAGPDHKPPCKLHGKPMYWDSMAYAHFPGANESDTNHETLITGPVNASQPAGFWANLLKLKEWWEEQLEAEGMMKMSLPAPSSTNGTYLSAQAVHSIVRSMITRQAVFHPRYGTTPGFGADNLHGLPEIYTSTAIAALEMGAMEYAKGAIHPVQYLRFALLTLRSYRRSYRQLFSALCETRWDADASWYGSTCKQPCAHRVGAVLPLQRWQSLARATALRSCKSVGRVAHVSTFAVAQLQLDGPSIWHTTR